MTEKGKMAAMGALEYRVANWADFCERLRQVMLAEMGAIPPGGECRLRFHRYEIVMDAANLGVSKPLNFAALRATYDNDEVVQVLLDILEHK